MDKSHLENELADIQKPAESLDKILDIYQQVKLHNDIMKKIDADEKWRNRASLSNKRTKPKRRK